MTRRRQNGSWSGIVSQKDVAVRAGVSPATVSRVINGAPSVDPAIRARVEEAVSDLRYSPNTVARSLRVNATDTIGVLVPEIANPFTTEFASGALSVFGDRGFLTMISASGSNVATERKTLSGLVGKRVDGLLVTPVDPDPTLLQDISQQMPVVLVDYVNSEYLDSVRVDNVDGAFQGVGHLVSRGYRHVATIAGPQRHTSDKERLQGFINAVQSHGLELREEYVRFADFFSEGGYQACTRLVEESPEVEAILVANNLMGVGALRALRDQGLRVPQDVALCIFDDFLMTDLSDPPLTVVAQPAFRIGERSAELLLGRIAGEISGPPRQEMLKPSLVVRAST